MLPSREKTPYHVDYLTNIKECLSMCRHPFQR
ncbi:hypothetical protein MCP1_210026 [Candidatus Terasakiella magnetica]|nr:hypothetical protein MCP1_210026 [Candidatus Terasakiella magnetica]